MSVNRGSAAAWALGLGVACAAVAGTVVSARTAAQDLRYFGAFVALFVPSLFVVLTRRWEDWSRTHPFVRFVVFFLSAFVAIVVLDLAVAVGFGGFGQIARAAEFAAGLAGFAVATWIGVYGGAERIWAFVLAHTSIEW